MDMEGSPYSEPYTVFEISDDILTIQDCLEFSKDIEQMLLESRKHLVLSIAEDVVLTGSILGFLTDKIHLIQKIGGTFVIIAPGLQPREVLELGQIDKLIPVFDSFQAFQNTRM
jgi:anti-anti-sigma regulatory factor